MGAPTRMRLAGDAPAAGLSRAADHSSRGATIMRFKSFVAGAAMAVAAIAGQAFAAASDYVFEPVNGELVKGDDVTVAVRLSDKRTGKSVPGALIIRTRL